MLWRRRFENVLVVDHNIKILATTMELPSRHFSEYDVELLINQAKVRDSGEEKVCLVGSAS